MERIKDLRSTADLLDSKYRGPFGVRFGWDAILGLFPVVGDTVGAVFALYVIFNAAALGAPMSVMLRMLLNVSLDYGIGAIPLIGDAFDIFFKANMRNITLLEKYSMNPEKVRRSSKLVLWSFLAVATLVVLGLLAFSIYFAVWLISAIYQKLNTSPTW